MQRLAILVFLLVLSVIVPPIYANSNTNTTDWLYFSATSGYQWPGWVYRVPLDDLSAKLTRLEFTINVTNFLTTPDHLYWSYLVVNNSMYTTYIGRALHNLSSIDDHWLEMGDCGNSAPYTWQYDIPTNTMWYQSSDATVCSLDLQSMTFTNWGSYRFSGGGIFNGGIELYREPPSSQNITGIIFGVDESEIYSTGAILYTPLSNFAPRSAKVLYTGLQFPRAGAIIPGTTRVVLGGDVTDGTLVVLDVPSAQIVGKFTPNPSPTYPCAAAGDPLTGDVYLGMPGANGDNGGVWILPNTTNSTGTYKRVIDPSADISCMACFCLIGVVRASARPSVPSLSALSPQSGSTVGGYTVYVWGSGFTNSSALVCQFGRESPKSAQFLAPSFIECVVPESPVAGNTSVRVSNNGGSDWSHQSLTFTYVDENVIMSAQ